MFYVILLVSIVSSVAIIVPSWSIIYDPYKRGYFPFTRKGVVLFMAVLALIALPLIQYKIQKKEDLRKDTNQKIDNDRRDSILRSEYATSVLEIKDKFDVSNFKTDSIISDNLGKYGYKFDLATNRIIKLVRDSSKIRTLEKDDPILELFDYPDLKAISIQSTTDKVINFKISISSLDAGSCCYEILTAAVGEDFNGKYEYLGSDTPLRNTMKIAKDARQPVFMYVQAKKNQFKMIYFTMNGKYKNTDQTKSFLWEGIYYYNLEANTIGSVKGISADRIIALVKNQNK